MFTKGITFTSKFNQKTHIIEIQVLCFFGGDYLTLIAACEAYRLTGYEPTVKSINAVIDDLKKIVDESKKDDLVDADGDGVADVLQVSNATLVQRKTLLFMRTVDPIRLSDALNGMCRNLIL